MRYKGSSTDIQGGGQLNRVWQLQAVLGTQLGG